MRTLCGLIVAALILAGSAFADTLFDKRAGFASIKAYQGHLDQVRQELLSGDDDKSEKVMDLLEETLAKIKDEGDAVFPLTLLADFVIGQGGPAGAKHDDDQQEDALDLILEMAESKHGASQRELAIQQLGRIADADQLADMDWAEEAVKALISLAEGDDLVLVNAALVALGRVAVRSGKGWGALAEKAAEALTDRLDDKNLEVRRIALTAAIGALMRADQSTGATDDLWEELEDAVADVERPALQQEVRARVTALATKLQGGSFQKQVEKLRDEVKGYKAVRKPDSASLQDCLKDLRTETDPADIESYLAKIEQSVKDDPQARMSSVVALAAIAADPEISAVKLRYLTDSLFTIAIDARSALAFHGTAAIYAELIAVHRNSDRATIPLAALPRLLAATDQPALLSPAVAEVRGMAMGALPHWIRRRLVSLIFLQAGDAIDEGTRHFAFQQLAKIGSDSASWAVRYEVLVRMRQLAKLAKNSDVQESAAQWN